MPTPTSPTSARLNPLTRISVVFGLAVMVSFTLDSLALSVLTLAAIIAAVVARLNTTTMIKAVIPTLALCILTIVLHLMFTRPKNTESVTLLTLSLNREALVTGLYYCWRIGLLMLLALSFARWISLDEFSQVVWRLSSWLKRVGINASGFAMALTVAIRFIPLLFTEYRRIVMAQTARGFVARRGWRARVSGSAPIVVPTVASALRRIDITADALTVRGWGVLATRTFYHEWSFGVLDLLVLAVMVACVVFLLARAL